MPNLSIHLTTARRFILGRQGLWPGRRWQGLIGTAQALRAAEAVQNAQAIDLSAIKAAKAETKLARSLKTQLA